MIPPIRWQMCHSYVKYLVSMSQLRLEPRKLSNYRYCHSFTKIACNRKQHNLFDSLNSASGIFEQQRGVEHASFNNGTQENAFWTSKKIDVLCKTKNVPEGFTISAHYADTLEYAYRHSTTEETSKLPVVIGLHGTPGSSQDLMPALGYLAEKGVRVIVPDFPGYGETIGVEDDWENHYEFKLKERSTFITSFLQTLGIHRKLSMLVCHSSGVYPSTFLLSQFPDLAESFMMINPGISYRHPMPIFPQWFMAACLYLWNSRMRRVVEGFAIQIVKIVPLPFGSDIDSIRRTSLTMVDVDYKKLPQCVKTVAASPIAISYIFCDGDPVLPTNTSRKNASLYGIKSEHTDEYDAETRLVKKGKIENVYRKGIMFTRKTHYAPKHEDLKELTIKEILALLSAVKPSKGT